MQTLRNNLATFVAGLFIAAALAMTTTLFGPWRTSASSPVYLAIVHDGDGSIRTLPLDVDTQTVVSTSLGNNTIMVESGTVRISEADCPNRSCVSQRPISQPGQQLICLPHKLWVEVVSDAHDQSAMNPDAVDWEGREDTGIDLVAC